MDITRLKQLSGIKLSEAEVGDDANHLKKAIGTAVSPYVKNLKSTVDDNTGEYKSIEFQGTIGKFIEVPIYISLPMDTKKFHVSFGGIDDDAYFEQMSDDQLLLVLQHLNDIDQRIMNNLIAKYIGRLVGIRSRQD